MRREPHDASQSSLRVGLFDVTLVEFEVHLQRPIGNAIQATQIELLRLIRIRIDHSMTPLIYS